MKIYYYIVPCILLIFPIFINVNLFINTKEIKFSIKLFKIIRILKGTLYIKNKKIIIEYLFFKKEISLKLSKLKIDKNTIKTFNVLSIKNIFNLNIKNDNDIKNTFLIISILNLIEQISKKVKPYLEIKNTFNIYDENINSSIIINIVCCTNFLNELLELIKKLWSKNGKK